MICHTLSKQYRVRLNGLHARDDHESRPGLHDSSNQAIGQLGTVATGMLAHSQNQIATGYAIREPNKVVRRRYGGRAAIASINDQRRTQKPAQIGSSR